MPGDLHIHTNLSDGTETPEKVVELAKKAKLTTIAITDHDVVSGIDRAIEKGKKLGVEVIPGIEFTTETPNTEVHILGYFIDYKDPGLLKILHKIQNSRKKRIFEMCRKLKDLGIDLKPEKVFAIAGHDAPGRPHVARALLQEGFIKYFGEAFKKYLAFGGPAYVSHFKLSPEDAIKLVIKSGGIPVFGHPAISNCDELIPDLLSAGMAGLEIHYPSHKAETVRHYLELAKKYNLLVTGGTDYHGNESGRQINLGDLKIPDELVNKLKDEYAHRNRLRGR